MMVFTESEKRTLKEIRKWLGKSQHAPYMFWFIEDVYGNTLYWEGGFELPLKQEFRNQYTIPGFGKHVVRNW